MDDHTIFILVVNGLLLLLVIFFTFALVRATSLYAWYSGIDEKQTPVKWRVLRLIVLLSTLGFLAALFNIALL